LNSDLIRIDPSAPKRAVVWHHWEAGQVIRNGRVVRHLPSGCVFEITWQGGDDPFNLAARLIDGPSEPVDEVAEIGRMGIGYFTLVGQNRRWGCRSSRPGRPDLAGLC
jgi:hypothetical protein